MGSKKQELGTALDDFSLSDIRGESKSLSGCLTGNKGAVVVFWSSYCSHCVRYDGYLNGFAARHPGLSLLAVASRQGETLAQISAAVKQRGLTFPILHDPDGALADEWLTHQTPRVFLLDPGRVLLYRGAIDNFKFPEDPQYEAYLDPAIEAFLGGAAIARAETASFGCAIRSVYYILPRPF